MASGVDRISRAVWQAWRVGEGDAVDWPKKLTSKLTERERDLLALLQVAAAFLAYVCISVYIDIYDTMSRVVWWVWVVGVPLFDFSRAKTIIRRILHASGSRRL